MKAYPSEGIDARWLYWVLAVFVAVMWFATLSSRPLFNPDEGRYAEIPREMLSGGDWIIPHLNGIVYIEKPPLQYWATALSLRVFGGNEFGARFYTALCALGTLMLTWLAAARLWGAAAAWRATAVLASMALFVVLGQLLTLDMSLTFYTTAALVGFLLAQQRRAPDAANTAASLGATSQAAQRAPAAGRRWMLMAWIATALGVLTKGLEAAVIPGAVLVLYSLISRDTSPWRRLHASLGLPIFLLITVPWHWLAARRLPDFLQFFFVHEHFARYLTPSADREEAWWFFASVLALGSLPWTMSALRVVALGWRRRGVRGGFDPAQFLWVWLVFVCLFFSLSDSKLIPYILPALPALALLIAMSSADVLRRELKFTLLLSFLAAVLLAAGSIAGPRLLAASERSEYFASLAKPFAEIAALLAVSALFVLFRGRRDVTRVAVFLGVGWCLAGLLLMRAAAAVSPIYSGIVLARALGVVSPKTPIYSIGTYDQTLAFYWRHPLELVSYRGELDYGLRLAPDEEIASITDFVALWQSLPDGYAVMERSMFDELKSRGVPMREIARDVPHVLAARR